MATEPETQAPQDLMPRYSPVCTYCWWWKPGDGHSCAAYMRANSIPAPIWNGQNHHTSEYRGDHGVIFVLHPDAAKNPNLPVWAQKALRVGSPEANAMLAKSEAMKAAKGGKKESK